MHAVVVQLRRPRRNRGKDGRKRQRGGQGEQAAAGEAGHGRPPVPDMVTGAGESSRSGCARQSRAGRSAPRRNRAAGRRRSCRSEEHTSELQSLMRISYAVFCLKKKTSIQKKQQKK